MAGRAGGYPSAQVYPSYPVRGGYSKDSMESTDAGLAAFSSTLASVGCCACFIIRIFLALLAMFCCDIKGGTWKALCHMYNLTQIDEPNKEP